MMQGPGVLVPLVWMFAPNVVPQSTQIVATEFSTHRLFWWNKFLVHNTFYVEKNKSTFTGHCSKLLMLFWSRSWSLPLR